jgi:copper(I)-binding protein
MRSAALFGACLALLAGCQARPDVVRADEAWVRLAAVPGRPAAAYLTIHGGAQPVRLLAVESPAAGASELHQSMGAGGMMAMQRLDGIDLPAHGTVSFAPGGHHVMLFGVAPSLKAGDRMPLSLRFAKGKPLEVKAQVVATGDPAPY